jgi:hypothetical protein
MGQFLFREKPEFYDHHENIAKSKIYFDCLGISEVDIMKLYAVFKTIDDDDSLQIAVSQIFWFLHVDQTEYNVRVLNIFDREKANVSAVSFRDFVIALWAYCTVCNSHMCEYVFDKYDSNGMIREIA